jgi:hypothetical protein
VEEVLHLARQPDEEPRARLPACHPDTGCAVAALAEHHDEAVVLLADVDGQVERHGPLKVAQHDLDGGTEVARHGDMMAG